ncbi:MAG: hypothetical protein DIU77_003705 [Thermocrispum agreste]|uniref:Uncharacterized protein n=1 Tax=Thermocrispum agreste TaxID=37925 RepID=A0ABD6FE78_9PSEU
MKKISKTAELGSAMRPWTIDCGVMRFLTAGALVVHVEPPAEHVLGRRPDGGRGGWWPWARIGDLGARVRIGDLGAGGCVVRVPLLRRPIPLSRRDSPKNPILSRVTLSGEAANLEAGKAVNRGVEDLVSPPGFHRS